MYSIKTDGVEESPVETTKIESNATPASLSDAPHVRGDSPNQQDNEFSMGTWIFPLLSFREKRKKTARKFCFICRLYIGWMSFCVEECVIYGAVW